MSWTRKLLPRSLRARLILSFGVLIFLSLFLAGSTSVYLLRDQQVKAARERVGLLADPIAQASAYLESQGATPAQIEAQLQAVYGQHDVRILLIDPQAVVVADTSDALEGKQITDLDIAGLDGAPEGRPLPRSWQMQRLKQDNENLVVFAAPQVRLTALNGRLVFDPKYRAVLAVEAGTLSGAWRDMLPRLFFAGGIAFVVAAAASGLLARSISRPLRQITLASEEMALGKYDQRIPSYGGEEVGRLATAFNNMAQQVSRSHRTLREFLANVSHELKTPLTSIQGFSQAMVDGSLQRTEDFEEAGRIINDEAQRMRGLVEDLLYLSAVEAGESVMQPERFSPNELMLVTQQRFARRAELADVALVVQQTPVPDLDADPRRIEQALANIVENAVRHTPAGGRVTMRSGRDDGHVRLTVHNTGSVIPPEALPRLFDRFYQVDPSSARVDGNSGLGLAITREIVEAHGGGVEVRSNAPDGTEFMIILPLPGET